MAQIYDSLKKLITDERIGKAAETLDTAKGKISSAASVILPSLLAEMIKKGHSGHVKEILDMAAKRKTINNLDKIYQGHGITEDENIGERFENAMLEDKNAAFVSAIASKEGMVHEKADRFTNWIAGTIAAYFGEKMAGGTSLTALLGELEKEKGALAKDIPADIVSKLGLGSLLGISAAGAASVKKAPEKPKKKNGWLIWLIILIVLILLAFFLWKSCEKKKAEAKLAATEQVEPAAPATNTSRGERKEITLPDGTKIWVYEHGTVDKIVKFLNSDEYKNASEDDLKKIWFVFDNVEFKHDSSSEFMDGTHKSEQLDNIGKVLKSYPDAKIKLGGFADKTGLDYANIEISKERAIFMKLQMTKQGASGNSIDAEGFSNEYAVYPVDAPDSQRAKDRDMALRFTK